MMIDGVPLVGIGQSGLLGLTVLFVLTDRLVWHTRLKMVESDRDWWRDAALRALGVSEKVTDAAEVLTTPDPAEETKTL